MAWKTHVLVVANVTADSDELLAAMSRRAARGPTSFMLLLPRQGAAEGASVAEQRLKRAVARAADAGLEIEGAVGDHDPVVAVSEAFDPRRYDEIIVSTLAPGISHWLRGDLTQRIGRLTGTLVTHVVSQEKRAALRVP